MQKSKEILQKTWAKLDPKRTGHIKLAYFCEVFTTRGEPMSENEMASVLSDRSDPDATIDFDEFCRMLQCQ